MWKEDGKINMTREPSDNNICHTHPAAAPRVVLTATSDATSPRAAEWILRVDPGLNLRRSSNDSNERIMNML
jgi:hypothetical protein